jgi:hypothetical protein
MDRDEGLHDLPQLIAELPHRRRHATSSPRGYVSLTTLAAAPSSPPGAGIETASKARSRRSGSAKGVEPLAHDGFLHEARIRVPSGVFFSARRRRRRSPRAGPISAARASRSALVFLSVLRVVLSSRGRTRGSASHVHRRASRVASGLAVGRRLAARAARGELRRHAGQDPDTELAYRYVVHERS